MAVQRAFVFWIDYQETRLESGDTTLLFKWKNSGATPTRRLTHRVNWDAFDMKGVPDDFTFPDTADTKSANGFLGPQAVHYALPITIPSERLVAASQERCRIFIWGWAEYSDVFDGTARHRTEFCSEYVVSKVNDHQLGRTLVPFTRFNGADADCMKKPTT